MSMFIIARTTECAVILADNLGHKDYGGGNKVQLPAPKLTHVAPCVFATHAGSWQPAYELLHNFHEFLLSSPYPRAFDELAVYLEEEGNRCYLDYCKKLEKNSFDLRVPLVLTGPYRHPDDVSQKISSTILVYETANKFKPTRSHGAWFAYDGKTSNMLTAILGLDIINDLIHSNPLAIAQTMKALHSFVAQLTIYVSSSCSVVIIGEEDEHTLIEGHMTSLPMRALKHG